MEIKKQELIKALLYYFGGMLILQTGAAIFILTEIGADPFTVFIQSISKQLKITPGMTNLFITGMILIGIFLIDRKRIKIGTVLGVLTSGPFIDLMIVILRNLSLGHLHDMWRILCVMLGCLFVGIGFSIIVCTKLGPNPNDLIPFMIVDRFTLEYRWVKVVMDLGLLFIGFILGGVVGIGTIIAACFIGPCIQFWLNKFEKRIAFRIYKTA